MNRALFTSESSTWATPWPLWHAVDAQLGFTLDACADKANAKHPRYFDERSNGLSQSWEGETVWCNPPYGRALPDWLERARRAALDELAIVCLLVPYRPDTAWWGANVLQRDDEAGRLLRSRWIHGDEVLWLRFSKLVVGVHGYRGRVRFGTPEGVEAKGETAPFPTALVTLAHPSRRPPAPRRSSEELDPLIPRLTFGWPR